MLMVRGSWKKAMVRGSLMKAKAQFVMCIIKLLRFTAEDLDQLPSIILMPTPVLYAAPETEPSTSLPISGDTILPSPPNDLNIPIALRKKSRTYKSNYKTPTSHPVLNIALLLILSLTMYV